MKLKSSLLLILFVTGAALAATIWPFVMASYFPGVTYAQDQALDFARASSLPRLVMLQSVSNIKRGHIVRILYPDGSVYDFETSRQCSPFVSIACTYSQITRVAGMDAPATASMYEIDRAAIAAIQNRCRGRPGGLQTTLYSVQTGKWVTTTEWDQVNQTMTSTGTYVLGALLTFTLPAPSPGNCP